MNPLHTFARWLDVRPAEYRAFGISALGAFCVISFLVVARSLREAFFISEFSVRAIPYVTIAAALISFPSVAAFGRLLAGRDPQRVFRILLPTLAATVSGCWLTVIYAPTERIADAGLIAFYMITLIGVLLLTSGFWILMSELFALRDAKRLFGMISGGGTLGAMLTGLAVDPLGELIGESGLVAGLVVLLAALYLLQRQLPPTDHLHAQADTVSSGVRAELGTIATDPHLRLMGGIVIAATMASFLVNYQFMEIAGATYSDADLAGFFARFYGMTGAIAFLLQVFVASRLLASAGIAATLSVLPIALLLGSTAWLAAPGLVAAVLFRGADNSLRRSLHRSVLEYLWVPVPADLRRKTKTFIDSVLDSSSEGLAAILVWLWVTALARPSLELTVFVIILALAFLAIARAMGGQYFRTLISRLEEGQEAITDQLMQPQLLGGEMTMTVTRFDIQAALTQSGVFESPRHARPAEPSSNDERDVEKDLLARLGSPDPGVVSAALEHACVGEEHIPILTRLLARDAFYRRAGDLLAGLGPAAVHPLAEILLDEEADFVVRRRIPRVFGRADDPAADRALLEGLSARRFEVRYRCAVALTRRRKLNLPRDQTESDTIIWAAVRRELGHERPIWELQRLLDNRPDRDDFVADKVHGRGGLSLEHSFRLLSLVLEPDPIRTAFHGVVLDDEKLRSISLEYLEQVLPPDIRERLWPFIGDISDHQRQRQLREFDDVVADLLKTGVTLFADPSERARLREALEQVTESEDE